jgi:hypothetical protein
MYCMKLRLFYTVLCGLSGKCSDFYIQENTENLNTLQCSNSMDECFFAVIVSSAMYYVQYVYTVVVKDNNYFKFMISKRNFLTVLLLLCLQKLL